MTPMTATNVMIRAALKAPVRLILVIAVVPGPTA
jgi:hypothetical protein